MTPSCCSTAPSAISCQESRSIAWVIMARLRINEVAIVRLRCEVSGMIAEFAGAAYHCAQSRVGAQDGTVAGRAGGRAGGDRAGADVRHAAGGYGCHGAADRSAGGE